MASDHNLDGVTFTRLTVLRLYKSLSYLTVNLTPVGFLAKNQLILSTEHLAMHCAQVWDVLQYL